jgi:hypothetical protein
VHLIPRELFDTLRALGYAVYPGELGENIMIAGLELERLPVGTIIRVGATAAIELTGLRDALRSDRSLSQRTEKRDDRKGRRASIQMRGYGHCHRGRKGGSRRHGARCAAAAAVDSAACSLRSRVDHRPTRAGGRPPTSASLEPQLEGHAKQPAPAPAFSQQGATRLENASKSVRAT